MFIHVYKLGSLTALINFQISLAGIDIWQQYFDTSTTCKYQSILFVCFIEKMTLSV